MKRLLLLLLLLSSCAVAVDVSDVNVAPPQILPEIALDKPTDAQLSISGTNEATDVLYVGVQYRNGTRWVTLNEPVEIVLNDSILVPVNLDPGTYTLRTALWGFKPEAEQEPDKTSIETSLRIIDNTTQLQLISKEWLERNGAMKKVAKTLKDCRGATGDAPECVISFIQDFQDFIWASHDVKDVGGVTTFTANLQPQFSSFLYFHNIVLTKIEANFLAYCQEMSLNKASLISCSQKMQTKDIQIAQKSLKQALKVLNGLLLNNSYEEISYGDTKGLFG